MHGLIMLNAFLGHVHFIETANSQPSLKRKCLRSLAATWGEEETEDGGRGEGPSLPLLSLAGTETGTQPVTQVLTQAFRLC